jgi:hydrogenase-4 membrane subunit HyfE
LLHSCVVVVLLRVLLVPFVLRVRALSKESLLVRYSSYMISHSFTITSSCYGIYSFVMIVVQLVQQAVALVIAHGQKLALR